MIHEYGIYISPAIVCGAQKLELNKFFPTILILFFLYECDFILFLSFTIFQI